MKRLLITTIAAVLVVGCGESQQSAPSPETTPVEPVAEAAKPEPPTAKAPDISIHFAARKGNIEAVKQHLAAGADVNVKMASGLHQGWTPLHWAAHNGHKEIVELLIAKGADVNAKDEEGGTPLHFATGWDHKEIVELLIDAGADVNAKANDGTTPIDLAIENKQTETADLLRKHGGKYSTINMAALAGDIEAIKEFLAAGSDVNAKDDKGRTPLYLAEYVDEDHHSPEDKAAKKETADFLRKHGGKTGVELSIHEAAKEGNIEAVKQHLAAGTDVNAKDDWGRTPLHRVITKGRKETAELLIAKGADVNAKDKGGGTPLHSAAFEGHKEIIELLIAEGADVNAKTDVGQTPLEWVLPDNKETADLLRKHGGKSRF